MRSDIDDLCDEFDSIGAEAYLDDADFDFADGCDSACNICEGEGVIVICAADICCCQHGYTGCHHYRGWEPCPECDGMGGF